jgi:hypothetical protein
LIKKIKKSTVQVIAKSVPTSGKKPQNQKNTNKIKKILIVKKVYNWYA